MLMLSKYSKAETYLSPTPLTGGLCRTFNFSSNVLSGYAHTLLLSKVIRMPKGSSLWLLSTFPWSQWGQFWLELSWGRKHPESKNLLILDGPQVPTIVCAMPEPSEIVDEWIDFCHWSNLNMNFSSYMLWDLEEFFFPYFYLIYFWEGLLGPRLTSKLASIVELFFVVIVWLAFKGRVSLYIIPGCLSRNSLCRPEWLWIYRNSCLCLSSTEIAGMYQQAWCVQCWESNLGLWVC